jgi:hypothetical protein
MHAFAADSKAVYSAIQLLSQNSLDKKDFDKQLYRITELLVPLYETATTMQRFDNNQQGIPQIPLSRSNTNVRHSYRKKGSRDTGLVRPAQPNGKASRCSQPSPARNRKLDD